MSWSKTIPSATDSPCNSVTGITNNWTAWTTWLGNEHYNMSSTLSGYHQPGLVSVLTSGTSSQRAALSSPGTGALWWDTTLGGLFVYRDDGWSTLTSEKYSRIELTKTTQSLVSGWNLLTWDDPSIDDFDEYIYATNVLTLTGEGYYLIKAQTKFPVTAAQQKGVAVYKDGTKYSQAGNYGANAVTCELNDIMYCAASTSLAFYAYVYIACTLVSANVSIVRLS